MEWKILLQPLHVFKWEAWRKRWHSASHKETIFCHPRWTLLTSLPPSFNNTFVPLRAWTSWKCEVSWTQFRYRAKADSFVPIIWFCKRLRETRDSTRLEGKNNENFKFRPKGNEMNACRRMSKRVFAKPNAEIIVFICIWLFGVLSFLQQWERAENVAGSFTFVCLRLVGKIDVFRTNWQLPWNENFLLFSLSSFTLLNMTKLFSLRVGSFYIP